MSDIFNAVGIATDLMIPQCIADHPTWSVTQTIFTQASHKSSDQSYLGDMSYVPQTVLQPPGLGLFSSLDTASFAFMGCVGFTTLV